MKRASAVGKMALIHFLGTGLLQPVNLYKKKIIQSEIMFVTVREIDYGLRTSKKKSSGPDGCTREFYQKF